MTVAKTVQVDWPFHVDIHGAFVRRTNLSGASLVGANLEGADATGASFRGADLRDANLNQTVLRGADLTDANNLTVQQLTKAIIDSATKLPRYIERRELNATVAETREL
jgi:uncharacterized protein YjbI with pentapeptide repeats